MNLCDVAVSKTDDPDYKVYERRMRKEGEMRARSVSFADHASPQSPCTCIEKSHVHGVACSQPWGYRHADAFVLTSLSCHGGFVEQLHMVGHAAC